MRKRWTQECKSISKSDIKKRRQEYESRKGDGYIHAPVKSVNHIPYYKL